MTAVYTPPTRPWAHQLKALAKAHGRRAFAFFMGKRTGKTKTLLDEFGQLELDGECQDLMVIAPGGVYKGWLPAVAGDPTADDAATRNGHLSTDLKARVKVFVWQSGGGVNYRKLLAMFMAYREGPRILLMNVEALSSVKEARTAAIAFLSARQSMCAIDESTIIKNPSSKRTKFVDEELGAVADWRRILSGFPNPKSPLDYYAQFHFLDWKLLGFRSYFSFRARYAELWAEQIGGRIVQMVKGYQNLDDLADKIDPHCFRVALKDCYDVPPKAYLFHDVELTPEQSRIYADMKAFATAQLDAESHVTATVVIAQITRLSQILCGHTVDEEGVIHEFPENRTAAVLDIVRGYDGKAVIWCAYGMSVEKVAAALKDEYGDESVALFWGGNRTVREQEEARFKRDPSCRFMVATAAAGGRGRTWDVADLIIYHSNTEDLEHRDQSEERGDAVDKLRKITVVDIRAQGTLDDKKIRSMRDKIDLATAVNRDGYRAWLI